MQIVLVLFIIAFVVVALIGMWKVYEKAGEPGWAAIIPIYNYVVLLRIAGKEWWWIFLLLIPVVGFIIHIIVVVGLANNFGKDVGFALGLVFLGPIFFPILGFGDSEFLTRADSMAAKRRRRRDFSYDDDDYEPRPRRRR
jgi:hypothetical protein